MARERDRLAEHDIVPRVTERMQVVPLPRHLAWLVFQDVIEGPYPVVAVAFPAPSIGMRWPVLLGEPRGPHGIRARYAEEPAIDALPVTELFDPDVGSLRFLVLPDNLGAWEGSPWISGTHVFFSEAAARRAAPRSSQAAADADGGA